MWDWSNQILKKKCKPPQNSLFTAYNDLMKPNNYAPEPINLKLDSINISQEKCETSGFEEMRETVLKKINSYELKGIELQEADYDPQNWQEMAKFYTDYQRIREVFLKLLGYSYRDECLKRGLTKEDIKLLCRSIAPENYNVHIKVPFDFGGSLDFSNFSLVQTHPTHNYLHQIFDMQIENEFLQRHKKIFIPYFEGKIYHG